MADEAIAAPGSEEAAKPDANDLGMEQIREMLLTLIPEAGAPVVWIDIGGNEYSSPPFMSARKQMRVIEILRAALPEAKAAMFGARDALSSGNLGGLAALVDVLASPAVLAALEEIFRVLHPDATPFAAGKLGVDNAGPGDVFSAEEMLRAVLPFSIRPVLTLADRLSPAGSVLLRAVR